MQASINEKRDALAAICRRFGVTRLEVFGSAARGGDFDHDRSDVDFLVTFNSVSLATIWRSSPTSRRSLKACLAGASISSNARRSKAAAISFAAELS
jgi:hypothetical protein